MGSYNVMNVAVSGYLIMLLGATIIGGSTSKKTIESKVEEVVVKQDSVVNYADSTFVDSLYPTH